MKWEIVNNQATCEVGTEFVEQKKKQTKHCPVVSQDRHLSLIDAKTYGNLQHQEWVAINIKPRIHHDFRNLPLPSSS